MRTNDKVLSPHGDESDNIREAFIIDNSIHENGVSVLAVNQRVCCAIGHEANYVFGSFHRHCKSLSQRKCVNLPIIKMTSNRVRVEKKGLGAFYHEMPDYLLEYSLNFYFSEYIGAAYQKAREFGFLDEDGGKGDRFHAWYSEGEEDVLYCQTYFRALYDHYQSSCFRASLRSRREQGDYIEGQLNGLVDYLLSQHSALCVTRADLLYKREIESGMAHPLYSPDFPDAILLEKVSHDLKRFINGLRQKAFAKYLVGYAWRLQFGGRRGYHIHFIAFFDGSKVKSDWHYADQIIRYWQKIAGHLAYGFNCSQSKRHYKRLGIGLVPRKNKAKVANLRYAAKYLAEEHQLLHVRLSKKQRTFGRSHMPSLIGNAEEELPVSELFDAQLMRAPKEKSSAFCRRRAMAARSPVATSARRFLGSHGLPVRVGRSKGKSSHT